MFFCASTGFMWDQRYRHKFWDGKASPRFKFTISKAFELVALFGPILYHRNPHRQVTPRKPLELDPALFGDVQNDQQAAMFYQQSLMEQQQVGASDRMLAELLSRYLNYTPGEMPGGGMKEHGELCVTEDLITGRG